MIEDFNSLLQLMFIIPLKNKGFKLSLFAESRSILLFVGICSAVLIKFPSCVYSSTL